MVLGKVWDWGLIELRLLDKNLQKLLQSEFRKTIASFQPSNAKLQPLKCLRLGLH